MAGEIQDTDTLNVNSQASDDEVQEVERLLNPGAGEQGDGKGAAGGAEGGHHDDDEEDDDTQRGQVDRELEDARTEEERETIRERRRQQKRDRRNRQRDRVATLERQLLNSEQAREEMSRRLLEVERNQNSTQYLALKAQIEQADTAIAQLEKAYGDAVSASDGGTAAEAMKRITQVRDWKQGLEQAKGQMEQTARKPQQPLLKPAAVKLATDFANEHKWYKGPTATDRDSKMLSVLDNSLTAEGWDPSTPEYWDELRSQGEKYLPHRFGKNPPGARENGYNAAESGTRRQSSRSPVAGSGNSTGSGGKSTYHLSSDRVRAMKEAGIWDDPERRQKMIKRYQELDAQSK